MASADIYGYGEEPQPYRASMDELGYGPVNDHVLGYGPTVPTLQDPNTKYRDSSSHDGLGYGSSHSDDLGYGFGDDDDGAGGAPPRRRERTRRRCSITKYSLDAQEEVKQIFHDDNREALLDQDHHHSPSSEDECCDMSLALDDEEGDGKRPGAPKRTKSGKMKFWKRRGPARTKTI
jgi:hypothetical protein